MAPKCKFPLCCRISLPADQAVRSAAAISVLPHETENRPFDDLPLFLKRLPHLFRKLHPKRPIVVFQPTLLTVSHLCHKLGIALRSNPRFQLPPPPAQRPATMSRISRSAAILLDHSIQLGGEGRSLRGMVAEDRSHFITVGAFGRFVVPFFGIPARGCQIPKYLD